ncbi:ABC-type spermidine/putrescine transport system permease subunit I [Maritalea mobilis]|uniref:ABC-type spermidine/putrescine transport system permease subunit I n=1 Tax=Maritalea mobilis TaxID=483324 RepID=A0A4R6VWN3_9HYPH|nr:ABC transporter permease [Maritalea mobilis]TDQ67164.1 ABC-type spermidine/putrescine transport system permease subunit I [Maritalea mobilis]
MNSAQSRLSLLLLFTPFVLWLALLIIIPHIFMLLVSISVKTGVREYVTGLGNYMVFFTEPLYWNTFTRTAFMSISATLLTLLIGFPVAYYIAKLTRGRTKTTLFLMCLIPFWVSELVRTFGWMILLRETGVFSSALQYFGIVSEPIEFLYNDAAIMIGLVYTSMLFMVVPLVTTLDSLDDSLIEAGYDLGGNGITVLREIIIPHAMPGIVSGCIVVFMLSLGNYLTPILLGGKDSLWFTGLIYDQFITRFNWELGSAFGFLLLILSSTIVWAGLKLSGQSLTNTVGR